MKERFRPHGPRVDLTGQKFGRLIVKSLAGKNKNSRYKWNCQCECGKETVVFSTNLKRNRTKSCGCYSIELTEKRNRKYSTEDSVYRVLLKNYKRSAKVRNLDFELDFSEFKKIGGQICFYCGVEPRIRDVNDVKNTTPIPFNGIDRVDSTLGYTIGNSVGCCSDCNYMKNSRDVSKFKEHVFRICLNNLEKFEKYKEVLNG